MNKLFALALLGAAGLALLNPALLPFVVAGAAMALAPSLVRRVRAAPRGAKWALAALSSLAVLLALAFLASSPQESPMGLAGVVGVSVATVYAGQARQDGEKLIVDDVLTIPGDGLRQAARKSRRVFVPGEGYVRGVRSKRWPRLSPQV